MLGSNIIKKYCIKNKASVFNIRKENCFYYSGWEIEEKTGYGQEDTPTKKKLIGSDGIEKNYIECS